MKEFLYFVYDGINSKDMGVTHVSLEKGLFEESFLASKSIKEDKVRGNPKPIYQGVERVPLEFSMILYFDNGFDKDKLRNIKRWLDKDTYKELYFPEQSERRYFCMMSGMSTIHHNGNFEGYCQINMRCNDSYAYSAKYIDNVIDLSSNPNEGTEIIFDNKGDVVLKPHLYIEKVGAGDISITNNSNGGEFFEIKNLNDGETIYIDNENEEIESDINGVYRYDDHNDVFLELAYGANRLLVKGTCKIQFKYRFKFK